MFVTKTIPASALLAQEFGAEEVEKVHSCLQLLPHCSPCHQCLDHLHHLGAEQRLRTRPIKNALREFYKAINSCRDNLFIIVMICSLLSTGSSGSY
jgi:hypothetical protein